MVLFDFRLQIQRIPQGYLLNNKSRPLFSLENSNVFNSPKFAAVKIYQSKGVGKERGGGTRKFVKVFLKYFVK